MAVFSAVVTAQAVTTALDLFALTSPSNSRIRIREIRIGQYSDAGDAAAEILGVDVIRGHRTAGNEAATATPRNLSGGYSGRQTDTGTKVVIADTGVATDTGSKEETLIADAMNVQAGWWYYPPEDEQIIVDVNQRLVVRLSAPADELTVQATLVYEKIGKVG